MIEAWRPLFVSMALRPASLSSLLFSKALRPASLSFWRFFFSPGSQRWQKEQRTPLPQPLVWKKAHGLQRPWLCPSEPALGNSAAPGAGPAGGGGVGGSARKAGAMEEGHIPGPLCIRGAAAKGGCGGDGPTSAPAFITPLLQ